MDAVMLLLVGVFMYSALRLMCQALGIGEPK